MSILRLKNPLVLALATITIVFVVMLMISWYIFNAQEGSINFALEKQNIALKKILKEHFDLHIKKIGKDINFSANRIKDGLGTFLYNYEQQEAKKFVEPYICKDEIQIIEVRESPDNALFYSPQNTKI